MNGHLDYEAHKTDKDATVIMLVVHGTGENRVGFESVLRVAEVMEQCLNLVAAKSQGYGDAWRSQGWMGNVARVQSKTARLTNMLWRDMPIEDGDETVEETLKDLMNLTAFTILNRRVGNRWGRGRGV